MIKPCKKYLFINFTESFLIKLFCESGSIFFVEIKQMINSIGLLHFIKFTSSFLKKIVGKIDVFFYEIFTSFLSSFWSLEIRKFLVLFASIYLIKKFVLLHPDKQKKMEKKENIYQELLIGIFSKKREIFLIFFIHGLKRLKSFLADIQCILDIGEKKMKNNLVVKKNLPNIAPSNR
jgi:hypothetical protein